jgi:hypothetical protein
VLARGRRYRYPEWRADNWQSRRIDRWAKPQSRFRVPRAR